MTIGTALISGNDPLPSLAEQTVRQALEKIGQTRANSVLLFLTPEFAHHAQQTVTHVARMAQCTQVAGGIAAGVFTEDGWAVDRPAAAAMVFAGNMALGNADLERGDTPIISYTSAYPPAAWFAAESPVRLGGCFSANSPAPETLVWQQSRMSEQQQCTLSLTGADLRIGTSQGIRQIGRAGRIERCNGFDLVRLDGETALANLRRQLPALLREHPADHLHHLTALCFEADPEDATFRPLALIAINHDESLTLSERLKPGQRLAWGIREPAAAEADMQTMLDQLADREHTPKCALIFSCIGRGPYFYGGEDRDLDIVRRRFPALPLIGVYGTGQIAPSDDRGARTRLLQNSAIVALAYPSAKKSHVQSYP